jgi:N-acylglucosamine-6-phosphate 2-epimerase
MNEIISKLKNGLIVSCQADGEEPFNRPELLAKFAQSAEMGGAVGIRAQGAENIKAIRAITSLPIIGIKEGAFETGWICITPDFKDVEELLTAGADIIGLDVTTRKRPNGMDGVEFFDEVRERFQVPLMADISSFGEGIRAAEMGANIVSTTLVGFTQYTEKYLTDQPDFDLIEQLSRAVKVPVISEGRVWSPYDAKESLRRGAFAVVVGSAITRPHVMTKKFVNFMESKIN